jgi:protein TonB
VSAAGLQSSAIEPRRLALWSGAALGALLLHGAAAFALRNVEVTAEPPLPLEQALEVELAPLQISTAEAVASEAVAAAQPTETLAPVDEAQAEMPLAADAAGLAKPEPAEPIRPEERLEPLAPDALAPVETAEPLRAEPAEPVQPIVSEAAEAQTGSPIVPAQPAEPPMQAKEFAAAEEAINKPTPVQPVLPTPADQVEAQEVPEAEEELVPLPDTLAVLPQARPALSKPAERQIHEEPRREAREQAARSPEPPKRKNSAANSRQAEPSVESRAAKAPTVSPAKWQAKVLARLNRFKRYPRGARDEGTVTVSFRVSASGAVSGATVTRSSGNPDLDRAALAMVRRASPVPAPPANIGATTITVPVRFSL